MNTRKKITLGVGLPAALIGLGLQSSAAAGPATAPPVTAAQPNPPAPFPAPTGAVPAEWPVVVDDTQSIAIAVPAAWTQVDTVPARNDAGTPDPWISATTDQNLMFPADVVADTFSVPGVVYYAAPYEADTSAALAASPYHGVCVAEPLQTFDNGIFAGHIQAFNGCGGTASRIVQVAAHPADDAFTANVLVQLTGQPDDAATLNGLLLSFGRVVPSAAS